MIDTASLQKYSLFGGLLKEQIEKILPYLAYASFDANTVVIEEGKPNDSIYFLLEGSVEVSKNGKKIVDIPEGQTFGEMELLDVMAAVATIRANGPVRTAILSNSCIYGIHCLDTSIFSLIIMNLARDLSRRLRYMDTLVAGMAS